MIEYRTGDATSPVVDPFLIPVYIAHVVNDAGKWGKGFVLAVSRRWPHVEVAYRDNCPRALGSCQFVNAAVGIWVVNLVAQHDVRSRANPAPLRLAALEHGLNEMAVFARVNNAVVQMPRIGCGLAGGSWEDVEPIIQRTCEGVRVIVFDPQ